MKKMNGPYRDPSPPSKRRAFDRVSSSLVNAILGALILWVGQTTFRHAGLLASISERFQGVGHQFDAVEQRHESLRLHLEQVVAQIGDRTRSRFTREDAEKIAVRIKEIEGHHTVFEKEMLERLSAVQLKVIALETHNSSSREVAQLNAEIQQLRAYIAQQASPAYANYAKPVVSRVDGGPVQLPSTSRR